MSVAGSFAPTFFFRVILPGVILATGLQPVVFPLYAALHVDSLYGLSAAGLFGVVAVASGLILAAADRPIYYLFEGFSLPLLTEWNRKRLSRRVDVLAERQEELAKKAGKKTLSAAQQLEAMRLAEQLRDIPVGVGAIGPQYQRGGPTKLANIIAAYELYSKSRYGIDGEFFLPHAFYLAVEGVRADLESSGAIADGMVLSCFGAI